MLQQIAAYLIIYRVAEGKAWGTNDMSGQTLTTVVDVDSRGVLTSNLGFAAQQTSEQYLTEPKVQEETHELVGQRQRQPYHTDTPREDA